MDKTRNNNSVLVNGIKHLSKWARRTVFIILAACMIGLSNAFNDENRMINDIRNIDQQEQLIDDDLDD